jgi:hypothetical protein
MEQQQQMDEKFMSDNGWQCKPYASFPVRSRARIMKRDKKSGSSSGSSSGSVKNLAYDYFEDIEDDADSEFVKEDDADSEFVKTIKRLRRNKINCQPDPNLSVKLQAMMMRGPMSMMDASAALDNEYAAQAAAAQDGRSPPSSPIPIPPRKKGGKKRSYKKRTNAKKRSTKKRTNAKKRSYKKRTNAKKRSYKKRN